MSSDDQTSSRDENDARDSIKAGDPTNSLLARIRAGDRAAAAEFVTCFEPQLRRRIRERLHHQLRPVFDTQDIFSTLCRRFDAYVSKGRVRATTLGEVVSLLQLMARSSMIDRARVAQRFDTLPAEDSSLGVAMSARVNRMDDAEFRTLLERCAASLRSDSDRDILHFWMMGLPHQLIAETLGMRQDGVRKRWQLIRERLATVIAEGET